MKEANEWRIYNKLVKDMKRRGKKEHLKQGDEQNKFIYYNKTYLQIITNSINKIIVCVYEWVSEWVCVCVCVCVYKKERKSVWKRRIYRKCTSRKRLQTQDESLRADVVLSRSRGSPGQWFPETKYVSVRHLCRGNKWHTAHIKL